MFFIRIVAAVVCPITFIDVRFGKLNHLLDDVL
jgi:hypothetical protein